MCEIYKQLYLQARFTWSVSKLLRHFLQAIAVYLAVYVSLSRISDYKHHWSDVLSGAILGCFIACLTVNRLLYFINAAYYPCRLSVGLGMILESACLSVCLFVCPWHYSKTNDPKVFILGVGNDLVIS